MPFIIVILEVMANNMFEFLVIVIVTSRDPFLSQEKTTYWPFIDLSLERISSVA